MHSQVFFWNLTHNVTKMRLGEDSHKIHGFDDGSTFTSATTQMTPFEKKHFSFWLRSEPSSIWLFCALQNVGSRGSTLNPRLNPSYGSNQCYFVAVVSLHSIIWSSFAAAMHVRAATSSHKLPSSGHVDHIMLELNFTATDPHVGDLAVTCHTSRECQDRNPDELRGIYASWVQRPVLWFLSLISKFMRAGLQSPVLCGLRGFLVFSLSSAGALYVHVYVF